MYHLVTNERQTRNDNSVKFLKQTDNIAIIGGIDILDCCSGSRCCAIVNVSGR